MAVHEIDQEIAATLERIREHARRATDADLDRLDDLQVKELQLAGLEYADRVVANDQQASILSVVVYVAVT